MRVRVTVNPPRRPSGWSLSQSLSLSVSQTLVPALRSRLCRRRGFPSRAFVFAGVFAWAVHTRALALDGVSRRSHGPPHPTLSPLALPTPRIRCLFRLRLSIHRPLALLPGLAACPHTLRSPASTSDLARQSPPARSTARCPISAPISRHDITKYERIPGSSRLDSCWLSRISDIIAITVL